MEQDRMESTLTEVVHIIVRRGPDFFECREEVFAYSY